MFHRPRSEEQETTAQKIEKRSVEAQPQPQQQDAFAGKKNYGAAPRPEQKQRVAAQEQASEPAPAEEDNSTMITERAESQTRDDRTNDAPASSPFQQRQPQPMQRSIPGSFGAPYVGASAPTAGTDPLRAGDERRLVIGRGITLSGEIESCDYLLVEGTLEAALKGAKVLEIADTGTFYGTVEIEEATIAGRFEGELTVNGRITVKSGGSITGMIAYKELAVEAGAVVDGKLSPLALGTAQAGQPKAKAMGPKNDNRGQRQDGEELPFSERNAVAAE